MLIILGPGLSSLKPSSTLLKLPSLCVITCNVAYFFLIPLIENPTHPQLPMVAKPNGQSKSCEEAPHFVHVFFELGNPQTSRKVEGVRPMILQRAWSLQALSPVPLDFPSAQLWISNYFFLKCICFICLLFVFAFPFQLALGFHMVMTKG